MHSYFWQFLLINNVIWKVTNTRTSTQKCNIPLGSQHSMIEYWEVFPETTICSVIDSENIVRCFSIVFQYKQSIFRSSRSKVLQKCAHEHRFFINIVFGISRYVDKQYGISRNCIRSGKLIEIQHTGRKCHVHKNRTNIMLWSNQCSYDM